MTDTAQVKPRRGRLVHGLRRLLVFGAVLLAALLAVGWWGQIYLVFPGAFVTHHVSRDTPADAESWELETEQGVVEAILMPGRGATAERPGPAVIFCHGNGELIHIWTGEMRWYTRRGYTVLLPEYRGYGGSAGRPSQGAIVGDLARFYDRLVALPQVDPDRVVLHGRSLGGGLVAQLADTRPSAAMILASTFTGVTEVAREMFPVPIPRWMIRHPLPVAPVLERYDRPTLILHGEADRVMPVEHARRNAAAARHATLVIYPGLDHNNMPGGHGDWRDILHFLDRHGLPWQVVPGPGTVNRQDDLR